MKFDTLIIGGGLAGLMCGIRLQKSGVKCAIISAGQSALHFSSGSFDLLNALPDGSVVNNPVQSVSKLPESHPYSKMNNFSVLAEEAYNQLSEVGILTAGKSDCNHLRLTPMGTFKSTWLTISDFLTLPTEQDTIGKKILLVNFSGFLDFNLKFVVEGLEEKGVKCDVLTVDSIPALNKLRSSATEMRATNIARVFENLENLDMLVSLINSKADEGYDMVLLPAVFDLSSCQSVKQLKESVKLPIRLAPTTPPSVAGIRVQQLLKKSFEILGGTVLSGDSVIKTEEKDGKISKVYTANHGDFAFEADNFVLATGSFFSKGLMATPYDIRETVFGADVVCSQNRADWYNPSYFEPQNYMSYGVVTDSNFNVVKNGKSIKNLYAIGSVLGGFNPMREGCGAGVSMLTALFVANQLKK